VQRCAS